MEQGGSKGGKDTKEHPPSSGAAWVSWVLLTGVVTASLLGTALPAWRLVREDYLIFPGILGTMGGCLGLLIWLLWRSRSTQPPDWVSLIAVGVIMGSYAVLTLWTMLIGVIFAGDPNSFGTTDVLDDAWAPRVTTAVASLGYVVLVVRRLERALRWKTKGALWSSAAMIIMVIVATIIAGGLGLSRPKSIPVPVVTIVPTAVPRGPEDSGIIVTTEVIIQKVPPATPGAPE